MDITHNPFDPRHDPDSYGRNFHDPLEDQLPRGWRPDAERIRAHRSRLACYAMSRTLPASPARHCRATLADSEQLPEDGPFSRPALLPTFAIREELAAAADHLNTARAIKANGDGAHFSCRTGSARSPCGRRRSKGWKLRHRGAPRSAGSMNGSAPTATARTTRATVGSTFESAPNGRVRRRADSRTASSCHVRPPGYDFCMYCLEPMEVTA